MNINWHPDGDLLSCEKCEGFHVGGEECIVECFSCGHKIGGGNADEAVNSWNTRDGVTHYYRDSAEFLAESINYSQASDGTHLASIKIESFGVYQAAKTKEEAKALLMPILKSFVKIRGEL